MGCLITKYLDERKRESKNFIKSQKPAQTTFTMKYSKMLSNYESPKRPKKVLKKKSKILKPDHIEPLLKDLQSKIYPYSLNPLRHFLTFMCFILSLTSMVFALIYEDIIENTLPDPKDLACFYSEP